MTTKTYLDPAAYRAQFVAHELAAMLEGIDRAHAAEIGSFEHKEPNAVTEYHLGFKDSFNFLVTAQSDLWKQFVEAMEERGFTNIEIMVTSDRETYTCFTYQLNTDV